MDLSLRERYDAVPYRHGAISTTHPARLGLIGRLLGLATAALGMATMTVVPDQRWLVLPLALYAFGQVAGISSAGELLLRLGGGGGRAVGLVRLTSDLGLVVGPAAAGMLTDGFGVGAPFVVLALSAAAGAVIAFVVVARKGRRALAIG